ncbi:MAG: hypothetical protein ACI4LA_06900 [Emergencia sp.]
MLYYLIFILVMPALIFTDYRSFARKMEKLLQDQPDYDSNRENYDLLLEKLMLRQKRISVLVCIVLCAAAAVLLFMSI